MDPTEEGEEDPFDQEEEDPFENEEDPFEGIYDPLKVTVDPFKAMRNNWAHQTCLHILIMNFMRISQLHVGKSYQCLFHLHNLR